MHEEDEGFFILVLGVLAAIVAVVSWWFLRDAGIDTAVAVDTTEAVADESATAAEPASDPAVDGELAPSQLIAEIDGDSHVTVTGVVPDEATAAAMETAAVARFGADVFLFVLTIDDTTTTQGGTFTISGDVNDLQVATTIFDGLLAGVGGYSLIDNTTVLVAEETSGEVSINVNADAIVLSGLVPDAATADVLVAYASSQSLGRTVINNLDIVGGSALTGLLLSGEAVNAAEKFALSEGLAGLANSLGVAEPVDSLTVGERPELENQLNALAAAEPIQFDTGSAAIRAESLPTLDKIAALLAPSGGTAVPAMEVQGHTDNTGEPAANVNLSLDRAVSVVTYLEQQGVNIAAISPIGLGANRPIATNDTDAGRQQNRRIEFAILG